MRSRTTRRVIFLCAAIAVPAPAQEVGPEPGGRVIEEIVVTAQKTEQSLQDVPISVSAISGEFVREAALTNLVDIVQYAPNVQFYESSSLFASFNIRGFATPPLGIGLEPSVGLVVDGVPYGRSTYAQDAVFDLERLEILRGPQGALFGKNTIAGVLSFVTAEPSFEPVGYATLSVGSLDEHRLEGGVGFPVLADVLAARLSFRAHEQDMDVFNTTRTETNDIEDLAGRMKLLWRARPDLDVGLTFWGSHLAALGTTAQLERATPRSLEVFREFDPATETDPFDGRASIDTKTSSGRTAYSVSLTPVWSVGDFGFVSDLELTAIAAWSQISTPYAVDPDFSPIGLGDLTSDGPNGYQQTSIEIRATGRTAPPFGWGQGFEFVAGLYGEQSDSTIRQLFNVDLNGALAYLAAGSESEPSDASNVTPIPPEAFEGLDELFGSNPTPLPDLLVGPAGRLSTIPLLPPEIATERILSQTTRDLLGAASFFHAVWSLSPRWDLTFGARLGFDVQDAHLFATNEGLGIGAALAEEEDFDARLDLSEIDFSPKIALSHHWTEGITFFAAAARGFKAGGFAQAPLNPDNLDYDAEKASSFELGAKSRLLDGALVLNATLFYSLLEDLQVRNFTGVTFTTENADRATSRGFELDFQWLPPLEGTSVAGSLGFLDAFYNRFPNGTATAASREEVQNLSGQPLPYTPDLSAALHPSIALPFLPASGIGALFGVDFLFRSSRFLDSDDDPITTQDATPKVNVRLGLLPDSGRWNLIFAGKNLSGVSERLLVIDQPLLRGNFLAFPLVDEPTFSIDFRYNFG